MLRHTLVTTINDYEVIKFVFKLLKCYIKCKYLLQ